MLQSMGLQRVGLDLATEQQQNEKKVKMLSEIIWESLFDFPFFLYIFMGIWSENTHALK